MFSGYEYSWTSTEIRDSETFNPIEGQHRTHLLSLTLACRQTYTETVLLFFKYNTLFIANDVNFEKWLAQTLLPAQIAAIEKVACMAEHAGHCFGRGDASCFTKFHEFKALKFVILRSRQLSMCGLVGLRPGRRRLVEGVKEANREKELEVIIEELVRTQWVMKCWINVGRPWCR